MSNVAGCALATAVPQGKRCEKCFFRLFRSGHYTGTLRLYIGI